MISVRARVSKAPAAVGAPIGPVSGMESHVLFQTGGVREHLTANTAEERSLVQVNSLPMSEQLLPGLELPRAVLAHLVSFVRVPVPHVQIYRSRRLELLAADGADVAAWLVAVDYVGMFPET